MQKYIKEYIGNESSSEIDFTLYDELYGKGQWEDDDNDAGDFEEKNTDKAPWNGSSYPTNLDDMILLLEKYKDKGATHLEIMYHEDHIGYEISFLKFNKK